MPLPALVLGALLALPGATPPADGKPSAPARTSSTPSPTSPSATARAPRPPRSPRPLRLEELRVEGRIQKPQAFYLLQRSRLDFEELGRPESFLPRVSRSVDKAPF